MKKLLRIILLVIILFITLAILVIYFNPNRKINNILTGSGFYVTSKVGNTYFVENEEGIVAKVEKVGKKYENDILDCCFNYYKSDVKTLEKIYGVTLSSGDSTIINEEAYKIYDVRNFIVDLKNIGCLEKIISNKYINKGIKIKLSDEIISLDDIFDDEFVENLKERYILNIIDRLSLDELISQMMIINLGGKEYTERIDEYLKSVKPGGVILFSSSFTTYDRTLKFVNDIKKSYEIPLFIATDEEGGNIQRTHLISDVDTLYVPFMNQVGDKKDVSLSYDVGIVLGEHLNALGFNMDFSPVADCYSNPKNPIIGKRAFSDDPILTGELAVSLASGLKSEGIISCFKHFPGHGDTETDSHKALPVIDKTMEELYSTELVPFIKAIDSGAELIMIGHLAVPAIDENCPASLSKKTIKGLLRGELGYEGLVITDALNMKGVTSYVKDEDLYTMAINAGVNILLMPSDPIKAIGYIKEAINRGDVDIEDIKQSVYMILSLKFDNVMNNYYEHYDSSYLRTDRQVEIINKIFE